MTDAPKPVRPRADIALRMMRILDRCRAFLEMSPEPIGARATLVGQTRAAIAAYTALEAQPAPTPEPAQDVRERLAKALCSSEGTGQCAALCLSHSSNFTSKGECPETSKIWKRKIDALIASGVTFPALAQSAHQDAPAASKAGERDERAMLQLIDARDAAEDALSQAFKVITGQYPEWSNMFGYKDALDEIEALRADDTEVALTTARAQAERDAKTIKRLCVALANIQLNSADAFASESAQIALASAPVAGEQLEKR